MGTNCKRALDRAQAWSIGLKPTLRSALASEASPASASSAQAPAWGGRPRRSTRRHVARARLSGVATSDWHGLWGVAQSRLAMYELSATVGMGIGMGVSSGRPDIPIGMYELSATGGGIGMGVLRYRDMPIGMRSQGPPQGRE